MCGLKESMQHKWSGDVDLDNGELQQKYQAYRNLLDLVKSINADGSYIEDLKKCCQILLEER